VGGGKAHLLISLLLSTMFFAFTLLGRLFGPVGLYERHDTYVNSYLMINCPIELYACFQLPSSDSDSTTVTKTATYYLPVPASSCSTRILR
jgi:hypothetical protein